MSYSKTVRRRLIVLAVIFIAGNAIAESNPPIPSDGESSKKKQYQSQTLKNPNHKNNIGTEARPFIVKVLNGPNSNKDSTNDTTKRNQESPENWWSISDWWVAIFTGLLVLVGVGQFGLFWWQLRLIRKSVRDAEYAAISAKEAAVIARHGVEISAKAYAATNRPWLGIDSIDPLILSIYEKPNPRVIINNSGNGPALNVRVHFIGGITPEVPNVPLFVPEEASSSVIMPKGQHWYSPFKGQAAFTQEQINGIIDGSLKAWVVARIAYLDAIGIVKHYTTIRIAFDVLEMGWNTCEEGNEAK